MTHVRSFRVVSLFSFTSILFFSLMTLLSEPLSADEGETIFAQTCAACHSIGEGRRVGPDLKNVHERRSQAWLQSFIKSSQSMVSSGDADAVKVFDEYGKMVMPDMPFTDAQIASVINHIKTASGGGGGTPVAAEPAMEAPVATDQDVARGRDLFQGIQRFGNGGPSCNSCHEASGAEVFGGGKLAVDLTGAFGRLGGTGIKGVLSGLPFPAMKHAYRKGPISDDESFALVAFLEKVSKETVQPKNYAMQMLGGGIGGLVVLFGLFGTIWGRRKKGTINREIYDRQVKSEISSDWRE